MVALCVTSKQRAVGKTAICAGLGKHLLDNAKKAGFFKPLIGDTKNLVDGDALFMKRILALEEAEELLCTAISDLSNLADRVKEAYAQVSQEKDLVMVEGIWEPDYGIVEALDAKVIIVEDYSNRLPISELIAGYQEFGEHLLGVVWNKVPGSQLEHVCGELSSQLGEAGINILGVLPEDRALLSLTVGELAEHIQGEILNCTEKSVELVENFMLGAMVVDSGLEYFGRKTNKAVVVRGERPDMQLAALETSTRCLVLSGNTAPIPAVLYRAEDKKIPIILAQEDTNAVVGSIEDALSKTRFNQEKKLPKLAEIMEQHFNFQSVYQGLGLAD